MGFTVDFSDFEKKFRSIVEGAIPEEAAKGLFKAGSELIIDAKEKVPKAPWDEGTLRRSSKVNEAKIEKDKIALEVGFNIVYAARWHELTPAEDKRINWTLPGSGAKYLESKMMAYKQKYMTIVAEHIKKTAK